MRYFYKIKESIEEENKIFEYKNFKNKYRTLHYKWIIEKYKEGYDRGILEGALAGDSFLNRSVNNSSINDEEKKLLKEKILK